MSDVLDTEHCSLYSFKLISSYFMGKHPFTLHTHHAHRKEVLNLSIQMCHYMI